VKKTSYGCVASTGVIGYIRRTWTLNAALHNPFGHCDRSAIGRLAILPIPRAVPASKSWKAGTRRPLDDVFIEPRCRELHGAFVRRRLAEEGRCALASRLLAGAPSAGGFAPRLGI